VGLSKEERRENIKGAFALKSDSKEKITHYSHIFLIDDVTTSGATLREAARVLKQAGAKHVWGLTLAHGE
jgi:predicted amidophosphoribosyltransferase